MTFDDVSEAVRNDIDEQSDSFITRDNILNWANRALKKIHQITHFSQSTAKHLTVLHNRAIFDKDDFVECDIRKVYFEGAPLIQCSLDKLERVTGHDIDEDDYGEPAYYYEWGNKLYIYPAPDAANVGLTVTVLYIQKGDKIRFDSDKFIIPDEFEDVVVEYCKWHAWGKKENVLRAAAALNNFQRFLTQMKEEYLPDYEYYETSRAPTTRNYSDYGG